MGQGKFLYSLLLGSAFYFKFKNVKRLFLIKEVLLLFGNFRKIILPALLNETNSRRGGAGSEKEFSQNLCRILIGRDMTIMASSPDKSGQAIWQLKNNIDT